jgi:transposase-like protein
MARCELNGEVYTWDDDEYEKPYRDPELLYELYYEEGYTSLHTIGDFFDVDGKTIQRWLEKGGYTTRSQSEALDTPTELKDEEQLRELYEDLPSLRAVADIVGVHHERVRYWMKKHGIERRGRLENKRHRHPVHISTHPDSGHVKIVHQYNGEKDSIELHRLLATVKYDIEELRGYEVHHQNHIPWDNRLENIELLTPSEHTAYHGRHTSEGHPCLK